MEELLTYFLSIRLSFPSTTEMFGIIPNEIKRSVVASPTDIIFFAFLNTTLSLRLLIFLSGMRFPKGSFRIRIHSGVRGILRFYLIRFCFVFFFLCIHLCCYHTYSSGYHLGNLAECM